ncbi:UNVERIFIED_CONTAM: Exonuclease DPD1, chloroplastic/mitochondrial [Sesamum radiatum]|uniref:Exonuclease DPD1, chloroplastic/mitochondrial n=1 Tax=Sesamum radiatum TaxID=300843 RepID=A0AAW2MZE8_SESRA
MKDLIPIFLQYVRSRQIPGGVVVLVSHNGRTFDVPFLKKEFSRCSYEIPSDWLFADTLPLARAVMKSKGVSLVSLLVKSSFKDITPSPPGTLWHSFDRPSTQSPVRRALVSISSPKADIRPEIASIWPDPRVLQVGLQSLYRRRYLCVVVILL